jgi:hypothetical protein
MRHHHWEKLWCERLNNTVALIYLSSMCAQFMAENRRWVTLFIMPAQHRLPIDYRSLRSLLLSRTSADRNVSALRFWAPYGQPLPRHSAFFFLQGELDSRFFHDSHCRTCLKWHGLLTRKAWKLEHLNSYASRAETHHIHGSGQQATVVQNWLYRHAIYS